MSSKEANSRIPRKNPIHPFAPVNSSTDSRPIPPSTRRSVASTYHGHQHQHKSKKSSGRRSVELENHKPDDDNEAIRLSLLKFEEDHQKMKLLLESSVKEAEERLEYMRILVEKQNTDSSKQQNEETYLPNSIDESPEPEKEGQKEDEVTEKRQKISKAKLKAMKEKLHEMNSKTQTYLDDVQGMKKDLEELEDISRRLDIDREDESETEEEVEEKPKNLPNSNDNNANSVFITEQRN